MSWQPFVGPALILLSAMIAIAGIRNARSVARQRATLDLIEKVESSDHYRARYISFYRVKREDGFARLFDPETDADRAARRDVIDYLNHYEIVSIGIRNDILDSAIYRAWMEAAFVRDWNAAADWIQRERWKPSGSAPGWTYHDKIYGNYQWLACRWSRDARRLTRTSSAPPAAATSPGDEPLPSSRRDGETS